MKTMCGPIQHPYDSVRQVCDYPILLDEEFGSWGIEIVANPRARKWYKQLWKPGRTSQATFSTSGNDMGTGKKA